MECLSDELLANVLCFLPPTDLLQSVPLVSKTFHRITDNDQFWKSTCINPANKAFLTMHQVQRSQLFDYCRSIQKEIPSFLNRGNLLVPRETATRLLRGGLRRACVASSTDHLQEQLENALMEEAEDSLVLHDIHPNSQNGAAPATTALASWVRWWSSAPAPTDQSTDVLLFSFRYPLASISDMYIKPLRDPYYENGPVYTWRKTILRVYNIPMEQLSLHRHHDGTPSLAPCSFPLVTNHAATLTNSDRQGHRIVQVLGDLFVQNSPMAPSDRPTIDAVLHGQTPVHEQQHYVARKCDGILSYTLPLGVIGNVIAVELVGKRYEQRIGSGYFACIERVECVGIPLDAVTDDDTSMDL